MARDEGQSDSFWLEPAGGRDVAEGVAVILSTRASSSSIAIEKLTSAVAGDASAAFDVASEVMGAEEQDDARSWLWVAASLGSRGARDRLVKELAEESCSDEPCRSREYLSRLAVEWLTRDSLDPKPSPPERQRADRRHAGAVPPRIGFAALRARSVSVSDDADEDHHAPVSLPDAGPQRGVVVLSRIGDANSREGRDITARYAGILARRLPFSGALPSPGLVENVLFSRWPWAPAAARFIEGRLALLRRAALASEGYVPLRLPPLLLVGPPGSGKTSFFEHLCGMLRLPATIVPCGGASDSAGLSAVSRGWSTARASAPVQAMAENECANPALILDEIDKGTEVGSRNGSAVAAALGMLTGPKAFWDSCLLAQADVSHVTFLATANDISRLPREMLDRFTVLEFPRPLPEHFDRLLDAVRNAEAERLGIDRRFMPPLGRDEREWLREAFMRSGRSVRALERAHATLAGELAAEEEAELLRLPN